MIGYWYQVIEAWYSYLGLLGILERRVGFFELDYRDLGIRGIRTHGVMESICLIYWSYGIVESESRLCGVPASLVTQLSLLQCRQCSRSSAVANKTAQSSRRSHRSVINRTLQNLSLIIALKIFEPNLSFYALTYCNRNAPEMKTVSQEIRLFSFSRRRIDLNDELYALRSNQTVLKNLRDKEPPEKLLMYSQFVIFMLSLAFVGV